MEVVPYHPILKVNLEEIEKVRKRVNLDENTINKNLDAIEEWGRKQEHLAEAFLYLDRNMLERLHLLGKGSIEMTKIRIDKLLTTRRMLDDICLNKSVDNIEDISEFINFVYLPLLNPKDQSRMSVTQIRDLDKFRLLPYLRYCFMVGEYRMNFEYSISEILIVDLKNLNSMSFVTKLNPILLRKAEVLATESYGMKIAGIHILNAPPFVDKVLSIFKPLMKEKIAKRIQIHHCNEELHNAISKSVLPEDYGGDLPSCSQLEEHWNILLKSEEAKKIITMSNKLVTDESKRSAYKFNEEYLGMPGSFRQLTVD